MALKVFIATGETRARPTPTGYTTDGNRDFGRDSCSWMWTRSSLAPLSGAPFAGEGPRLGPFALDEHRDITMKASATRTPDYESKRDPHAGDLYVFRGRSGSLSRFARTALAVKSLETIHFGPEYCRRALSLRRAANGEMEMTAHAMNLQAAENDLKELMADVTRAMEKAQEAVARIASRPQRRRRDTTPPSQLPKPDQCRGLRMTPKGTRTRRPRGAEGTLGESR